MENDLLIIDRVDEIAKKYNISMSQVALAWLWEKGVAAPIVGATSVPHFDDAVKAVDVSLSREDIVYLEEIYERHKIVGALPEE